MPNGISSGQADRIIDLLESILNQVKNLPDADDLNYIGAAVDAVQNNTQTLREIENLLEKIQRNTS